MRFAENLNENHLGQPSAILSICRLLSGEQDDNDSIQLSENEEEIALENELLSAVATTVAIRIGWQAIPTLWKEAYDITESHVSAYLAEVDRIASQLAQANVPLIALKNVGIARGIYPYTGACPMGDVDLLVSKKHFRYAHQILIDSGYQFAFRSELEKMDLDEAESNGGTEYWKELSGGQKMWFELQWRPVSGRWIRPDQEPSADELISRSIPVPDSDVRLLAPEDNLLQVALHTAKHSYVRAPGFRLHLDVERIVRAYPGLDWALFLSRVQHLQVKTAVYFSLVIPQELLGTPIPNMVLDQLRPSIWKEKILTRLILKAGLLNPNMRKFSAPAYILFTALLYDNFAGLWRSIFPQSAWMKQRYQFDTTWLLPYYHVRRIFDLLFRRLAT